MLKNSTKKLMKELVFAYELKDAIEVSIQSNEVGYLWASDVLDSVCSMIMNLEDELEKQIKEL